MFKRLFPVLLIAVALLAACVPAEPPPATTPAPTAAPTQAPAKAAPTTAPAAATSVPATQAAASNTPRLRKLDFTPFDQALAGLSAERAAKIEALVKDADIAKVQAAMQGRRPDLGRAHALLPVAHQEV